MKKEQISSYNHLLKYGVWAHDDASGKHEHLADWTDGWMSSDACVWNDGVDDEPMSVASYILTWAEWGEWKTVRVWNTTGMPAGMDASSRGPEHLVAEINLDDLTWGVLEVEDIIVNAIKAYEAGA